MTRYTSQVFTSDIRAEILQKKEELRVRGYRPASHTSEKQLQQNEYIERNQTGNEGSFHGATSMTLIWLEPAR